MFVKYISVKQGEARPVILKARKNGKDLNGEGATVTLAVKRYKEDDECIFSKSDADFDKSLAASGLFSFNLTSEDTNQEPDTYVGELKLVFGDGKTIKSDDIDFIVNKAVA